ncbi:hypothetical protein ACTHAM_001281 [Cellulomonas soli]|uniref:hypothetical protein n=1 Tax=Cellulomonas soli TaxID=931535 RepID=UPI003F842A76
MTSLVSPRRRARRWAAPLAAIGSLVLLWWTHLYYSLAQWTFLEVPPLENIARVQQLTAASQRASRTAEAVLMVAAAVVLAAGLAGAVRPVRRGGLLIAGFTGLALVAVWVATRADVALLDAYRA